jgi:hypothetical protein
MNCNASTTCVTMRTSSQQKGPYLDLYNLTRLKVALRARKKPRPAIDSPWFSHSLEAHQCIIWYRHRLFSSGPPQHGLSAFIFFLAFIQQLCKLCMLTSKQSCSF